MEHCESRDIVGRYVAAAQAGDADQVRELFADDATWTLSADLPIGGTWRGRDAIVNEFLPTAMSYYRPGSVSLEITDTIVDDDRVVLQWTSRAETRDGLPYENGCIGVFTVRGGRITDVHEYMDTLYARTVAFGPRSDPAELTTDEFCPIEHPLDRGRAVVTPREQADV
jgi:uncharacterized protein (TIGR02246 family)